jgi:hypothetical protein
MANGRLLNIKEAILLVSRVIGAAVFGVVALSVSYELILRSVHAFNAQHEHFLSTNPKMILLADSRGVHAVRRTDVNFYNYAHFGEYPFAQILRGRHAMRDKPGIRVIAMQLEPYVVLRKRAYAPLPASRGFSEYLLFSTVEDVQQVVGPDRQEFWRNVLGFVFPLSISWERADFWGALRHFVTSLGLDNAPKRLRYLNTCGDLVNNDPSMRQLSQSERLEQGRIAAEGRYKGNRFDPSIARLVEDFIREATARGIRVIGVRFPETAEYRRAADPVIDPAAEAFVTGLRVPILDYRDGLSTDLFNDPEHLTEEGAAILSRRFDADIRSLTDIPTEPWNCISRTPLRTKSWPYAVIIQRLYRLAVGEDIHG